MDRIKIFQIIIYLFAALIVLRLFYWQFIGKIEPQNRGSQDEIPAPRGEIITSDGFPIVANQEAFLLYAKPNEVKDPKKLAQTLAPYLIGEKYARPPSTYAEGVVGQATQEASTTDDEKKNKDEEIKAKAQSIQDRLENRNLLWVQIARKIPQMIKDAIVGQKVDAIGFEPDQKRLYAEGSMAAQLLGFVGSNQFGEDTGYFGLEGYYERKLQGKPGRLGQETDPLGLPILVSKYRRIEPEKGSSLHLSIDRVIQFMVEGKLKAAVEKYGAKSGTVIIEDPKTGKIIAMASYPTYNPTTREEYDEKLYQNPAIIDAYEPGSTFKVLVMSAALDLGLVDPNTKCTVCSGPREISGYKISTWDNKYFPNSTMTDVIVHSDNTGMTFVADKLGVDNFYSYITKFGFSKPTGIDLQGEVSGELRAKQDWKPIDLATASFGQGLTVTPLQMVQAVSAIANGGIEIDPKVTSQIENSKGQLENVEQKPTRVISEKTAAQMTEMMVSAVENGEAKFFAPKGYRIAGKTGTAQIPVAGHYDPNKTIASFVGFAPANNPRFVMLVRFTEPSASIFGAETAAPTFFDIAKEMFNYWGIPPSR
ncbi:MAG TPA: penicillin-binding protein 2 [Candidatus Saccharimonadales bacterium]|nr:penicillin-binding protein 2 [Candidatus Saccharimonadales bacterium]